MNSLKWLSIEVLHGLFNSGNLAKIEKSQGKGIENREHMRNCSPANPTRIFGKSAVATVLQTIFDVDKKESMITCCIRYLLCFFEMGQDQFQEFANMIVEQPIIDDTAFFAHRDYPLIAEQT